MARQSRNLRYTFNLNEVLEVAMQSASNSMEDEPLLLLKTWKVFHWNLFQVQCRVSVNRHYVFLFSMNRYHFLLISSEYCALTKFIQSGIIEIPYQNRNQNIPVRRKAYRSNCRRCMGSRQIAVQSSESRCISIRLRLINPHEQRHNESAMQPVSREIDCKENITELQCSGDQASMEGVLVISPKT